MCVLTQKILFASTCAMQCLVFLCATNFEKPITVINGSEGSKIEEFYQLQPDNMNLKSSDLFLDNVTGDFYNYSSFTGQWMPIGNAGLHSNKAAQTFNSIGKYMIKAPVYKPQPRLDKYGVFLQRNYETICSTKKIHIQHWVIKDVETEFVVSTKNAWDVHPFNFVNSQRTFFTLAESSRGPILIEIGENIIGAQFSVEEEYPETIKIFRNFIQAKLKVITNLNDDSRLLIEKLAEASKNNYIDPLAAARNDNQNNKQMRMLGGRPKSGVQSMKNVSYVKIRPTSAKNFSHVGFASKRSDALEIIDNNAIQVDNLISSHKKNFANQSISLMTKNLGSSSCENFLKSEEDMSADMIKIENEEKKIRKSRPQTAKIMLTGNFSEFNDKSAENKEKNEVKRDNFEKKFELIPSRTQYDMRKMLHPNTKPENLPQSQGLWVILTIFLIFSDVNF